MCLLCKKVGWNFEQSELHKRSQQGLYSATGPRVVSPVSSHQTPVPNTFIPHKHTSPQSCLFQYPSELDLVTLKMEVVSFSQMSKSQNCKTISSRCTNCHIAVHAIVPHNISASNNHKLALD